MKSDADITGFWELQISKVKKSEEKKGELRVAKFGLSSQRPIRIDQQRGRRPGV
jgi:hypothetical protein